MFNSAVCVWECPTFSKYSLNGDKLLCAPNDRLYCSDPLVYQQRYESHNFLGYCMPDMLQMQRERPEIYREYTDTFYKMISSHPAGRVASDIWVSSKILLSMVPMTFLLCATYVYMVSQFADVLAWIIIAFI